ncbi:MAG: glutathionylspermidine synthase family protein [Armatimonadetes bacterium]|nr:glutathionylspermidine synthase family protein [Armatimonadota bacterium]
MRREERSPRPDWAGKVEKLGLLYHSIGGDPYWDESAMYVFEPEEIDQLESATNELHEMCLSAVEHLIETETLGRLGIPSAAHQVIAQAWDADPPAIYGRFDLAYDGTSPPKLLEYNADTPTSLLEAAVIQWHWLQETEPEADQFNSIWEALVAKWSALKSEGYLKSGMVHFGCMDVAEDVMTTAVMMDTAAEAGLDVKLLQMRQVGWDSLLGRFVDDAGKDIETMFKLYPWEWMLEDEFGPAALQSYGTTNWIEPIWKMALSNKAVLAVLWELFPGHPNLLPCYLDGPHDLASYVKKPLLGREGSNVTVVHGDEIIETEGPYDEGGFVYQAYAPLARFGDRHAVIGSWVVDCGSCGIGVRESDGPITEDLARFVPHLFLPRSSTK